MAHSAEPSLVNFWKTNSSFLTASTYLPELQKLEIRDPGQLQEYLDKPELYAGALFSSALLESRYGVSAPTNMIRRAMEIVEQSPPNSAAQLAGIRLLLNHYPEWKEIMPLLEQKLAWKLSFESSYQILDWLGEIASERRASTRGNERLVRPILNLLRVYTGGGMGSVGTESNSRFLSSIRWELYEKPDVANECADFLVARVGSRRYQVEGQDLVSIIDFLLQRSKAEEKTRIAGLGRSACGETNRSSLVLWMLHEAEKTNRVAHAALEHFATSCPVNKIISERIKSGEMTRTEAFEDPLRATTRQDNLLNLPFPLPK